MKFSRLTLLLSTALAAIWIAGGPASAQSESIVSHALVSPEDAQLYDIDPGELVDGMLYVDPSVFDASATLAARSHPSGVAGVGDDVADDGSELGDAAEPEAFGRAKAPYTASRVAVSALGASKRTAQTPVTSAPFRSTGKLYAKFGKTIVVCTASLIKKGILVTAAHCISQFGKGEKGFATSAYWYPAQFGKKKKQKPYGKFNAVNVFVPIAYPEGTDTCQSAGKFCNNDLATVVLAQKTVKITKKGVTRLVDKYAGEILGTYRYGFNAYGFKTSPFLGTATVGQVTQLGYPTAFDRGNQMQRNDAIAWYIENGDVKGFQMGSAQTAGSDGGPWLVNFGTRPNFNKKKASLGSKSRPNVVVAVTSYAARKRGTNLLGGTYFGQNSEFPRKKYGNFGAGNIGALLQKTCEVNGAYC